MISAAALSAGARGLLAVFNVLPGANLLLSPEWVIVAASDDYLAATLTQRATLVGQFFFDAFPDHPQLPEANVRASLARVLATGQPHEMAPQPSDVPDPGQPGWFERHWLLRHTPVLDAAGQVQFVIQSVQDITARRVAEQQLPESPAAEQATPTAAKRQRPELRHLLEQTLVAVAVYQGPQFRVAMANATTLNIWDRPLSAVLHQPVFEVLPEVATPEVIALFERVFATGIPHMVHEQPTFIHRHGQQQQVYWNFVFLPQHGPDGRIRGLLTVGTDVTEQVRARQQVEAREASFRTMADAVPAMLWVTDPAGYCTYLNAQWYLFTGQTEAEALGLGWTRAVHPDDADLAGQSFLQANARREQFLRYRLRRHDGVYRWATDTGWPHFTETGAYAGIVGTVIDVHEQQLAEDELQASNEQLTRTNADLDTFIYTASHDLRTPIANIEGLLTALRKQLPAEALQVKLVGPILDRMHQSVERFQRTIAQLTDVAQLQQIHGQPAEPVDLATLVDELRLDFTTDLATPGATLTVEVAACPQVAFAPKNLRSIVYNLLSNALKYRHPARPPVVALRCRSIGDTVVLEVQDNGLGLTEVQQSQLFGLFQRLHTHVAGTGIGLYMVKRLVENAGGTIAVHSRIEEGTTFTITLPAHAGGREAG
jgi:PAS domain S-box-containing protein